MGAASAEKSNTSTWTASSTYRCAGMPPPTVMRSESVGVAATTLRTASTSRGTSIGASARNKATPVMTLQACAGNRFWVIQIRSCDELRAKVADKGLLRKSGQDDIVPGDELRPGAPAPSTGDRR